MWYPESICLDADADDCLLGRAWHVVRVKCHDAPRNGLDLLATPSKFWVYDKRNCTKVFMLKMGSHICVKMIFNDFEIICWEILELFTDKVD